MEFLYTIITTLAFLLLLPIAFIAILIIRIFSGKSFKSKAYHPVAGTVFHPAFHFNRIHDYTHQLAKQNKTFRLLAPNNSTIVTTDVRNIEYILKTNFDMYQKGKYLQDMERDLLGQGIFNVDGFKWLQQRKLASVEFSTRVLRDFSCKIFRRKAVTVVTTVSEFCTTNTIFDVQDLFMKFTLDSIFEVGLGVDLKCVEGSNEAASAFSKAFDDSNESIVWRHLDPFWKLKRFLNIGSEASLKKNIKLIHNFVEELIIKKREQLEILQENYNYRDDILTRLIVESKKDPEKMNDEYLRDITLNFIFAGKDTAANTLSWFFYMISKNPLIQERIAQEIREVVGSEENESIDKFVEKLTAKVLDNMHYLHAALTETLRLYPAVPSDGRHAEADDILPDGFKLKKGDAVFYIAYAMGRMHHIWGEDAGEFRPERWLKNGIFQPESPFKFVSFHGGPRMCLGKDFAYRQMKIVCIALLRLFRFKLADENQNVTYRTLFTLHINGGLHLRALPRLA